MNKRKQSHNGLSRHRFAGAGLTDQADDLTRFDLKADTVERLNVAVFGFKPHPQGFDLQQCHGSDSLSHGSLFLDVQQIHQRVTEQIKPQNRDHHGQTRKDNHPGRNKQVGGAAAHHGTPTGQRRLGTES